MKIIRSIVFSIICFTNVFVLTCGAQDLYHEQYRPQIHFSPKEHWVNDPNGMVYYDGIYHLFFQYYPGGTTWGPMHWGHATSTDLIHWAEQPIALYPDSLGFIFSGSAVVDANNTSGLSANGKIPLIAIYTSHDPGGRKAGRNDYENQSIAYSLDNGKTWEKFSGNPVLKNPGITDFRDPKVMWYEPAKKWIMTLATKDRITFFSSPDLKNWKKESEFGNGLGAHGGVWECPDLFPLNHNGKKIWVLVVNINPGGPNKGSATQYFLGDFDGNKFIPNSTETKWLDYGPDEYAGITWSNTGDRKIFLGWMSNWMYANQVPTVKWRSAMTIPRELKLQEIDDKMYIASAPVQELSSIQNYSIVRENIKLKKVTDFSDMFNQFSLPCKIDFQTRKSESFIISLFNSKGEKLEIGYDKQMNEYFIDRTKAGRADFNDEFAAKHTAPRFSHKKELEMTLIFDESSVELFADDGLSVMTEIFFPETPFNKITISAEKKFKISRIGFTKFSSIWPK
jgi:fructan beta-fructosidase